MVRACGQCHSCHGFVVKILFIAISPRKQEFRGRLAGCIGNFGGESGVT